MSELWNVEMSE